MVPPADKGEGYPMTFELKLNFKIPAWESANYVFGDPCIKELHIEAHRTYPDFDGGGLEAATEFMVQRLEALNVDRYTAEEWPDIRAELSNLARKSLLTDRKFALKDQGRRKPYWERTP